MQTTQVSAGTAIVTLSQAKEHLRILHDDEDAYITSLIDVAKAWAENDTDCIFTTSSWKDTFDGGQCFQLQKQPVKSITTVTIDDVETELYNTCIKDIGFSNVTLSERTTGKVEITYVCGLNRTSQSNIAKHMVLLLVGQMFNFREPEVTTNISKVMGYEQLKLNLKVV